MKLRGIIPRARRRCWDLRIAVLRWAPWRKRLSKFLVSRKDVGAVLGLGGSGNTAIVTTAMRALPVGVPKLMVSTVASGNVAPYVGPSDIAMMYAVVDVAGLNAISRKVIANAAHAAAGMALNSVKREKADKPGVGLTMFGVTTSLRHANPRAN